MIVVAVQAGPQTEPSVTPVFWSFAKVDPTWVPGQVITYAGGAPPAYVITCPGTHVGSTLAKLQKTGVTDGSVCGPACTATTITYTSGTGMQVQ